MKPGWPSRLLALFGRPTPNIPDKLWQHTLCTQQVFTHLSLENREKLKILSTRFLAQKEFTGAGGLVLRDEMLVQISAQACLLILELGLPCYQGWEGIIVYPNEFVVPRRIVDEDGIVHEFSDTVSGEAWEDGPVILSWRDNLLADRNYNVVIHEFAHKLDMLNGSHDGIPALHSGLNLKIWEEVLFGTYDKFCRDLETTADLPLDPYAAEDPAEFFAVASESFFANPLMLRQGYPALYQLLSRYYRQDPSARR